MGWFCFWINFGSYPIIQTRTLLSLKRRVSGLRTFISRVLISPNQSLLNQKSPINPSFLLDKKSPINPPFDDPHQCSIIRLFEIGNQIRLNSFPPSISLIGVLENSPTPHLCPTRSRCSNSLSFPPIEVRPQFELSLSLPFPDQR